MTWTYDPTLATDRDKVRLYIGDRVSTSQLFSDEEIAGVLAIYTSPLLSAAALADGLAAKFSTSVTFSVEGLRIENSTKAANYRTLALRLRAQAVESEPGGLGVPFVGGTSISDIDSVNSDPDREPNRFRVGMMDFPGTELSGGSAEDDATDPGLLDEQ